MRKEKNRICPVERSKMLDNSFRKWLQNPRKILGPYLKPGMTVMDVGCGPGYFSIDMAQMVGNSGKVIAVDLQDGMLERLYKKIVGTELQERIVLHQCQEDEIGVVEDIDFVLLFYVAHEFSDPNAYFEEIASMLKPEGKMMIVEPSFHVSKSDFMETVRKAEQAGLVATEILKVFLSRSVLMHKA